MILNKSTREGVSICDKRFKIDQIYHMLILQQIMKSKIMLRMDQKHLYKCLKSSHQLIKALKYQRTTIKVEVKT